MVEGLVKYILLLKIDIVSHPGGGFWVNTDSSKKLILCHVLLIVWELFTYILHLKIAQCHILLMKEGLLKYIRLLKLTLCRILPMLKGLGKYILLKIDLVLHSTHGGGCWVNTYSS